MGGRAALDRVSRLLFNVVFPGRSAPAEIKLKPLQAGQIILEDDKFLLSAFAVRHRGP